MISRPDGDQFSRSGPSGIASGCRRARLSGWRWTLDFLDNEPVWGLDRAAEGPMSRASICLFLLAVVPVTASVHAAVSPAAKCAAAKQKAAVKKVGGKLKCHQKAAATGDPVDADCLAAVEEKFAAAIAKADSKGGCVRTGDAAAIEAAADRCIADIGNETPAEPPTCGATAYPECGGSCPASQRCQAIISTRFASSAGSCSPVQDCSTSCVCRNID